LSQNESFIIGRINKFVDSLAVHNGEQSIIFAQVRERLRTTCSYKCIKTRTINL